MNKKLIFFKTQDTRILLFLVVHYTIKAYIVITVSPINKYTSNNVL